MQDLSIDIFWKNKFVSLEKFEITPLNGWMSRIDDITYFVEPKLTLRADFSDLSSRIWLVSAPGAVGKSTLAKKIAYEINALYLDLSQADTIGGNYIYGGLAKTKSQISWDKNTTTLFIDALDEARLRVTNQSFTDFLQDLISISSQRAIPIVLFGRSGVIDDIALYLMEYGANPTIFEIEYFDFEHSLEFVKKYLYYLAKNKKDGNKIKNLDSHKDELEKCISKIIESLDKITKNYDSNFSGYSPVLQAIATFILAESSNLTSIQTETENLLENRILEKICRVVLQREQEKLKQQVIASFPNLSVYDLYNIREQISYLSACCQGKEVIPLDYSLQGTELEFYTNAVRDLLTQHPFLAGDGKTSANAVFEAAILAYSMKQGVSFNSTFSEATVNPLLAEFYFYDSFIYKEDGEKEKNINSIHVSPIFNSISARIGQGNKAELFIEAEDDAELADITISRFSKNAEKEDVLESFSIYHRSKVVFYDRISNINITAPLLSVEIEAQKDAEFIAPISMSVYRIDFLCEVLRAYSGYDSEQTISLEAKNEPLLSPQQIIPQNVDFAVSWPNDRKYPWSATLQVGTIEDDGISDNMKKALFSFSRLIRAFRSHSKGEKKRFVDKIDHARMSKNFGKEIREQLIKDSVLVRSGIMYTLKTDKLGQVTGTSYLDAKQRKFGEKAKQYIQNIIDTVN